MNSKTRSCSGCLQKISNGNYLSCSLCNEAYDLDCANINTHQFAVMSKDKKGKWVCPGCNSKKNKSDNTNTPVVSTMGQKRNRRDLSSSPEDAGSQVDHITQRKKLHTPMLNVSSPSHIDESLLLVIRSEIQSSIDRSLKTVIETALNREFESLKFEINSLKDLKCSLEFLSDEYDKIKSDLQASEERVKSLTNSNQAMQARVEELSHRLNLVEQHSRETNIEINGIPENKTENLTNIAKQLCTTISVSPLIMETASCTRVRKMNSSVNRPRAIVVKLSSIRSRDEILAAVSQFNKNNQSEKLNTEHLGFSGAKTPVYVSEHLSPYLKALHARTRHVAREKSYEFVWIRNGHIFVRKNDKSPATQIKTYEALNKL
ncbi:unnamed protein product [Euphydryas editha]|uniref:PHD-type domain-containing protein n=1 Tax=Euphydryas editha TaxID=104508 RepID=A0AAU9TZL0_EUPED|nr:unnamed protein product [Euphydryas editha]